MPDRCFICRCEDVTVVELDRALQLGLRDVEELKRYTGLGTGFCQGKECVGTLLSFLSARGVVASKDLQPFTTRPPIEPVMLGALASSCRCEDCIVFHSSENEDCDGAGNA